MPLEGGLTPGGSPGRAFFLLSVLAICIATLRTTGSVIAPGWSYALTSGDQAVAELIQNLLLFIPFGLALAWRAYRWRKLLLAGIALSFTVEFLQQWIPGRDPSVGDIIVNGTSTLLGGALVWTAPHWLYPPERRASWFALGAAAVATTVWLGTGWLLRPMLPAADAVESIAPALGQKWDVYSGRVLSVTGRLAVTEPVRIVTIVPTAGPTSQQPAPILAVDDGPGPAGTIISVDRSDLVLRNRSRSMFLTLDRPDLRIRDAFVGKGLAPGDTLTISARTDGKGPALCLALNKKEECGLGYTMGDGWKLIFYPEHFSPLALHLLNACWIAGGCLGLGWWGRRNAATGLAFGLVAVVLLVGPGVVGLLGTPVGEWVGALGGVGLGWWGSRSFARARAARSLRMTTRGAF